MNYVQALFDLARANKNMYAHIFCSLYQLLFLNKTPPINQSDLMHIDMAR